MPAEIPLIPVSAVIATKDRLQSLCRTLDSLLDQGLLPAELIIVDSSATDYREQVTQRWESRCQYYPVIRWQKASQAGAAAQRNEGVALATCPFIWFFDDDVTFDPGCLEKIWQVLSADSGLGGVNAMIKNQQYSPPGRVTRWVLKLVGATPPFPGRIHGPGINLLPEDSSGLPEVVPVDWLNAGCVIYRKEALPTPPFPPQFQGYSMMEDVTLSW